MSSQKILAEIKKAEEEARKIIARAEEKKSADLEKTKIAGQEKIETARKELSQKKESIILLIKKQAEESERRILEASKKEAEEMEERARAKMEEAAGFVMGKILE